MSENLWVEKYRPGIVDDTIIEDKTKKIFNEFIKNGEIPNLMLCGTSGTGKTTIAKALCAEIGADYIMINTSVDNGIGIVRNKIQQFASTTSLSSSTKVIILDEADNMTHDAQSAIRGVFEEFYKNCRFILTCNYKNRLIEPIHSRCAVIDFAITPSNKPVLALKLLERIEYILTSEGVVYDKEVVVQLIMKYFPDFRRLINELQRYSNLGSIDVGVLSNEKLEIDKLVGFLSKKEFTNVRKWVVDNLDNESDMIYRSIYNSLYTHLEPASIPEAVVIIAEYQYKSAFVADPEINILAALTEIMLRCNFK
jgi:DNA polymerase III delta prime subunit